MIARSSAMEEGCAGSSGCFLLRSLALHFFRHESASSLRITSVRGAHFFNNVKSRRLINRYSELRPLDTVHNALCWDRRKQGGYVQLALGLISRHPAFHWRPLPVARAFTVFAQVQLILTSAVQRRRRCMKPGTANTENLLSA